MIEFSWPSNFVLYCCSLTMRNTVQAYGSKTSLLALDHMMQCDGKPFHIREWVGVCWDLELEGFGIGSGVWGSIELQKNAKLQKMGGVRM